MSLNYSVGALELKETAVKDGNFIDLDIDGYTYTNHLGLPKLPLLRKIIRVPMNAGIEAKIIINDSKTVFLSEQRVAGLIIPRQASVSKSDDPAKLPFVINQEFYSGKEWTNEPSVSIEEIGMMRGTRLVALDFVPVQYNPATGQLQVITSCKVEVTYTNADWAETQRMAEKYYSSAFEPVLAKTVFNYEPQRTSLDRYPLGMIIVTPQSYVSTLQPFINWKIQQGYNVTVATTETIGSSTTAIKSYIQNIWDNATTQNPAPSYLLIAGDTPQVPAWTGSTSSGHVTDLTYARLQGTDYLPEMYFGRFSATNITQLQSIIDKTLQYETYTMPDPSYLSHTVLIAGTDNTYGPIHGNGQINYGKNNYYGESTAPLWTPYGTYQIRNHMYLHPASGTADAAIIQNMNDGIGYANYTAHGGQTSWSNPTITISNINSMTNNNKYFVAVGNCCLTNAFDTAECFGEAFVRASNKGAVAYVGATNTTYWDEDYYWAVGYKPPVVGTGSPYVANHIGAYDALFHSHNEAHADWASSLSAMVFMGNLAVAEANLASDRYWEIYSIMGDPSLIPYMGIPTQNNATYPSSLSFGETSMQITADPFTYAALSVENQLISAGLTDASGNLTLTFPPISNYGTYNLVMTRSLRKPIIATFDLMIEGATYWNGNMDTNWHNSYNWSTNMVPISLNNVVIPSGLTRYPVVSTANAVCRNLYVFQGANLTISGYAFFVYVDALIIGQLRMNQANSQFQIAGNITWGSGSTASITNNATAILCKGSMTFNPGSNVQLLMGDLMFDDVQNSSIINKSSLTEINNLKSDKTSPANLAFSSESTNPLTIRGNLANLQNRTMYNYYTGNIFLKGNLISENTALSGGLMWYHGTLVMDGTNQNISFANASSYINNLTASQTGTLTYSSDLLIKGNLTVENGSSITIGANHLTVEDNAAFYGQLIMNSATGNLYVQGSINWETGSTANIANANADIYCQGNMFFSSTSNVLMTMGYIEFNGSGESAIINNKSTTQIFNLRSNKTAPGYLYNSASSTASITIGGSIWNYQNRIFHNYYTGNTVLKGNLNNYNTNTNGFTWETGTLLLSGSNHSISLANANDCVNNLTLNHTGSVTTSYDLKVKGALNMISGTFSPGTSLVYIGGNWTKNPSAVFTNTNSTIIFNGNSTQTIGSTAFNILRMNKSGGNLKINTGSTVTIASYKYDLGTIEVAGGTFTVNDLADNNIKGSYILSSGTINLTQDNTFFVDLDANLNISGGVFNINGGFDFPADWAYTRNINVTMSGGILDWGTRSIGITTTGYAVTFNLTGGVIKTKGNISIARPNVQFNGGSFELYGTTDATVSTASTSSLYDLIINKTASRNERDGMLRANTITLNSNLTISRDLIITAGTLNLSTYTLTANNNVNITGLLKMTQASAILNVFNTINWYAGSSCDITSGNINVYQHWYFHSGAAPTIGVGNVTNFIGVNASFLHLNSASASFGSIVINKTGISAYLEDNGILNAAGNLTVNSENFLILRAASASQINGTLNVNGSLMLETTSSLTAYDITLAGTLTVSNATVTVTRNCTQQSTGNLTINSGSFTMSRAYTGNFCNFSGITNLNDGILEVTNDGIQLGSSALLNQSGGTIKVGYYFKSIYTNVYQPTGGNLEFLTARHGYLEVSNGSYLHNLFINKSGSYSVYLVTDITVNNDLTVQGGYISTSSHHLAVNRDIVINGGRLVVSQNTDVIYVGRNWTNNVGTTGFTERSGTVYFNSNQAATITPDTFYNVSISKTSTSTNDLTQTSGTLLISGNLNIQTGILKVNPGAILDVNGNLSLNGGGLDLNSNAATTTLRIAGGLFDERDEASENAGFIANIGCTVIFDGSGDQALGSDLPEDVITLCDVTVNKAGGAVKPYDSINILGDFNIINGEWGIGSAGKTKTFYADVIIDATGSFSDNTGMCNIINNSDANLKVLGIANFGTLTINKGAANSVNLTGNVILGGTTNVNMTSGRINLNGYTWQMTGTLNMASPLYLQQSSVLSLGNNSVVNVNNGGRFITLGSQANPALVTSHDGYYAFNVNDYGKIGGSWGIYEKMNINGILFAQRTTIDSDYPMQYPTFRDGAPGGSLLRVGWYAVSNNVIQNPIFPANTWGGLYNVSKPVSNGSITLQNATGAFAGASFENDQYNKVHWTYVAAPGVPQNVVISITGSNAVLTWNSVARVTGYKIYRTASPDLMNQAVLVGTTAAISWTDTASASNPKAFYFVKSYID